MTNNSPIQVATEANYISRSEYLYRTKLTQEDRHELVQYAIEVGYHYSPVRARFTQIMIEECGYNVSPTFQLSGLLDRLILDEVRVFDPEARWVYVPKEDS